MVRMKMTLRLPDRDLPIDVTRRGDTIRLVRDGVTHEATIVRQDGAAFVLRVGQRLIHAAIHTDGDQRQLWANGRTYRYERLQKRRSTAGRDEGSLSASIPAVVSDVLVEVGDAVAAGQKLILLESMKMVIPIVAPAAGVVSAIHCQKGDAVQPNVPLIAVEAADAAST